jgi:hypothetical protein
MTFDFTPEEAQGVARCVNRYLRQKQHKVRFEVPVSDEAPYRTTILASIGTLQVLVDAQGSLRYEGSLKDLMTWASHRRLHAEIYVAVDSDSVIPVGALSAMKQDGVGLLVVDSAGKVSVHHKARNPALVVTPDPGLKYGRCRSEVLAAVQKFNETDRKDGLRDMCELVERETETLALMGVRAGLLKMDEASIKAKDWSEQIDTLASANAYNAPHRPVVSTTLKADLHSFRGARNLVDHKVQGKRAEAKRQMQFAERMMQGPRLTAELLSLQRKVK